MVINKLANHDGLNNVLIGYNDWNIIKQIKPHLFFKLSINEA